MPIGLNATGDPTRARALAWPSGYQLFGITELIQVSDRMAGMDIFDTPVPANAFPLYIAHRQEV
jgi:hypothetical protein